MDKFDRMIIRSHTEWQARRRLGDTRLVCPGCGETRPDAFDLHHIAGAKFGEESLPLCIVCHRQVSRWQDTEHPEIDDGPPTEKEKMGRFLIGRADVEELKNDRMREIGELLIAEGRAEKSPPKE